MCHTESVFGQSGQDAFVLAPLLVPTNRYPPTVFTLLTFFDSQVGLIVRSTRLT